eukprot:CAMPEP_0203656966 /NCGR_PEP_ID=MMETSP0088-20131115/43204_1 /ASSEMBLY_ACC=CAM_ASM_001087 /TAXON_ID=426623 /ORGANISM="Chaetoceros affinis, Strain CCMP159" /LENGTH=371 /DNA_ID=CAMNT_0050518113 /DNA_START=273 /DNA_END=1388 /DNA_ORIENTATION=+
MTATYIPDFKGVADDNVIVLAGGCTGDGNVEDSYVDDNGNTITNYYCTNISKKVYAFYPNTMNIIELRDMPAARYRHSAAHINGKLYIIGGRTLELTDDYFDQIPADILEYDPATNAWSTFDTLDPPYTLSDHASFARDGAIYVLGGYDINYDTRNAFFSIDIDTKQITDLAPMLTKRGDANAAYYNHDGMEAVFIMGGFSKETTLEFCEPLEEAEMYNFATKEWTEIAPLNNQRGDKGVVVLNNRILAIGGEDKHESLCSGTSDVLPSSHAIVVDDVETYNPLDGDDATWEVESDFAQFRFRTASAVYDETDTVYIFGGQLAYDPSCTCYKTSTDIYSYREVHDHPSSSSSRTMAIVVGAVVGLVTAFMV